jgi:hypothetical protein
MIDKRSPLKDRPLRNPGQSPDEQIGANPTATETRLHAGQSSFPLIVFYGNSIRPVTFTAMLDDANISSRFTPAPGTFEIVPLPLHRGSNTLVLSVAGLTLPEQNP